MQETLRKIQRIPPNLSPPVLQSYLCLKGSYAFWEKTSDQPDVNTPDINPLHKTII